MLRYEIRGQELVFRDFSHFFSDKLVSFTHLDSLRRCHFICSNFPCPCPTGRQAISAKTKLARQKAQAKNEETELAQESMVCLGLFWLRLAPSRSL